MEMHIQLATMSRWYVVSRAIHTIAQLGLANHMSDAPVSVEVLAEATGTKAALLDRILSFLTAYQLFHKTELGYTLTPLSEPLRDDDPHSIRAVLCMADEYWWQAFSQMGESLKTGTPSFELQHQDPFFVFLSQHPAQQENFDAGMAKLSTYDDELISLSFDFSSLASLADMGGGLGGLSKALQIHYPNLAITLFDTPAVINQLDLSKNNLGSIHLVAGDFLKEIPQTEGYLFKGVLHDFNDETMKAILVNCRQQMKKNAVLFIAEQILPDTAEPHPNKTMDIVMMVLLGGRQRSLSEWQKIIEPCGFIFESSYPTKSVFTLLKFKQK